MTVQVAQDFHSQPFPRHKRHGPMSDHASSLEEILGGVPSCWTGGSAVPEQENRLPAWPEREPEPECMGEKSDDLGHTYRTRDLDILNLLPVPVWVFNFKKRAMVWCNNRGLKVNHLSLSCPDESSCADFPGRGFSSFGILPLWRSF